MRGAPTWAILAVALQMPAADTSYVVRLPADLCQCAECGMQILLRAWPSNAATRVLDSRQTQKTCLRRGAPHHLYDSKAAMAIRDMDVAGGACGILMSGLVPPCTLIAVLKRHG